MNSRVSFEAPLQTPPARVPAEWIDHNGHMNVAYYVLAFDLALDAVYERLDFGRDYIRRTHCSHFTLDVSVAYAREVVEGDPLAITFQLLDFDEKRFHYFLAMRHAEAGYLAATSEQLGMHVDLATRRSAPMPPHVLAGLGELHRAHAVLPVPPLVGRRIGIRRKPVPAAAPAD